jgi:serine/threonine protein kinase
VQHAAAAAATGGRAVSAAPLIPWESLAFERNDDGERVQLGRGGAGVIYAAEYSYMRVAVKVLALGGRALTERERAVLLSEAALQASVTHENVVRVYSMAENTRNPLRPQYGVVLARASGGDLGAALAAAAAAAADARDPLVALPVPWRLWAAGQIAAGLAHLHARHIVHGDVKPANVLLMAPHGGVGALALTDFGLARGAGATESAAASLAASRVTGSAGLRGTVRIMAPELLAAPAAGARPARPCLSPTCGRWAPRCGAC